jgi:hypothetical protein
MTVRDNMSRIIWPISQEREIEKIRIEIQHRFPYTKFVNTKLGGASGTYVEEAY